MKIPCLVVGRKNSEMRSLLAWQCGVWGIYRKNMGKIALGPCQFSVNFHGEPMGWKLLDTESDGIHQMNMGAQKTKNDVNASRKHPSLRVIDLHRHKWSMYLFLSTCGKHTVNSDHSSTGCCLEGFCLSHYEDCSIFIWLQVFMMERIQFFRFWGSQELETFFQEMVLWCHFGHHWFHWDNNCVQINSHMFWS